MCICLERKVYLHCGFPFYLQYLEFSSGQDQRGNSALQVLQLVFSSAPPFIAREGVPDSHKISLQGKSILLPHPHEVLRYIGQDPKKKASSGKNLAVGENDT